MADRDLDEMIFNKLNGTVEPTLYQMQFAIKELNNSVKELRESVEKLGTKLGEFGEEIKRVDESQTETIQRLAEHMERMANDIHLIKLGILVFIFLVALLLIVGLPKGGLLAQMQQAMLISAKP